MMQKKTRKASHSVPRRFFTAGATLAVLVGTGLWWIAGHPHHATSKMVYLSSGYGGFVPAPAAPKHAAALPVSTRKAPPPDPVQVAQVAYTAGHYKDAQQQARQVIFQATQAPTAVHRHQAAFARQILAYSAARQAMGTQHTAQMQEARTEFAALRVAAAALPDKGLEPAEPGEVPATLEAEAAFQHAVCTGALGDTTGAEWEYVTFMQQHPDSPLLHAAVIRLQKMHGGDLLPAEDNVRRNAVQIAAQHQQAQRREASLCGPECLAELLHRRGEPADVHALADEMHTSDRGTTLAALADSTAQHGFRPQGLALTPKGLAAQRLPVIALVSPGHYVLVDAVSRSTVTLWDPDAHGLGHGGSYPVPSAQWQHEWQGVTLALAPAHIVAPVQTAHR